MRGMTVGETKISSSNELDFGFPYGKSKALLALRHSCCSKNPLDDLGFQVLLFVNGQFVCDPFRGDKISVKFDNSPVTQLQCNVPSDGSTNVIFIDDGARGMRFYSKLEKSSRLIIEAKFFQHGSAQMFFDVAGFELGGQH
jgi:hypothetical protein